MITRICLAALCAFLVPFSSWAQPKVKDLIRQAPSYASCNYYIYPDSITKPLTPSPEGKKPFYISHYGRHGSRYISSRSGYDIPYIMIQEADSLEELTPEEHGEPLGRTHGLWQAAAAEYRSAHG